jgi:hypothetical protein
MILVLKQLEIENCGKKNGQPAHNRSVTASPPVGGSGYTKTQSGYALCAFLFRHIFAFARNCFAVSLSQKQKRQLQPERYAKLGAKWLTNKSNGI